METIQHYLIVRPDSTASEAQIVEYSQQSVNGHNDDNKYFQQILDTKRNEISFSFDKQLQAAFDIPPFVNITSAIKIELKTYTDVLEIKHIKLDERVVILENEGLTTAQVDALTISVTTMQSDLTSKDLQITQLTNDLDNHKVKLNELIIAVNNLSLSSQSDNIGTTDLAAIEAHGIIDQQPLI